MANPPKAKGTRAEKRSLTYFVRKVHEWRRAHRSPACEESCDYWGTYPVMIENKKTKKPHFFKWIRAARKACKINPISGGDRWLILYQAGDTRSILGNEVGHVAIMPEEFALECVQAFMSQFKEDQDEQRNNHEGRDG